MAYGLLVGSFCVNTGCYCLFVYFDFALLSVARPLSVFRIGIPLLYFDG